MAKRKRADVGAEHGRSILPKIHNDPWKLNVENTFYLGTPYARMEVLGWLAALFMVRNFVGQRRTTSRASNPRQASYERLPKDIRRLADMQFPGSFTFVKEPGVEKSPKTTVLEVLMKMKVNEEATDFCTVEARKILEGATSAQEK